MDCLYEELRQQEEMEFLFRLKVKILVSAISLWEAPGSVLVDVIRHSTYAEFVANYLENEDECYRLSG